MSSFFGHHLYKFEDILSNNSNNNNYFEILSHCNDLKDLFFHHIDGDGLPYSSYHKWILENKYVVSEQSATMKSHS